MKPTHFAACVLHAFVVSSHAQEPLPPRVPPTTPIADKSQEDWSAEWWQWAGSFERKDSPIADQTGDLCHRKQAGPVWFLAGTYGTRRTVRTCTIPSGKHLFFPLINYVVMPPAGEPLTCDEAKSAATEMTEGATSLVLEIDGVQVRNLQYHRQATKQCFDMGSRAEPQVHVYPSAANGYYVMLRPLAPGRHTLNFGGALPRMVQAVTYTLIVE